MACLGFWCRRLQLVLGFGMPGLSRLVETLHGLGFVALGEEGEAAKESSVVVGVFVFLVEFDGPGVVFFSELRVSFVLIQPAAVEVGIGGFPEPWLSSFDGYSCTFSKSAALTR